MSPVHLLLAVVWAMSTPSLLSLLRKHWQLLMSVTMAPLLAERPPRQLLTTCLALVCSRPDSVLTLRTCACVTCVTPCSVCARNGALSLRLKRFVTSPGWLRVCMDVLK